MLIAYTLDIMKWKWYLASGVFLLNRDNFSLIMRKISAEFHFRGILENT